MPPLSPQIMQMLASLGGPGGPGGAPGGPPGMPAGPGPMGGMPPMMGPGGPPGGAPPPLGLDRLGQEGMDALGALTNGQPSGELRVERIRDAMDVIHKIVNALVPIVGTENMDMSKQLFTLGRQLAQMRINLSQQNEAGIPPEAMLGGIQSTGLPNGRF